ncbi:MAG: hypothetical protein D6712_17745 [Chloroflexi bacterium]|nr:MAG: hypothetical protein D6712_17745 [Chloroflexota bacterium]
MVRKPRRNTARFRMWRMLKSGRVWHEDDIALICGTSVNHVRKYLRLLVRQGYILQAGHTYKMLDDTGDLPPVETVPNRATYDPNTGELRCVE